MKHLVAHHPFQREPGDGGVIVDQADRDQVDVTARSMDDSMRRQAPRPRGPADDGLDLPAETGPVDMIEDCLEVVMAPLGRSLGQPVGRVPHPLEHDPRGDLPPDATPRGWPQLGDDPVPQGLPYLWRSVPQRVRQVQDWLRARALQPPGTLHPARKDQRHGGEGLVTGRPSRTPCILGWGRVAPGAYRGSRFRGRDRLAEEIQHELPHALERSPHQGSRANMPVSPPRASRTGENERRCSGQGPRRRRASRWRGVG